jgi:hypothetical protein
VTWARSEFEGLLDKTPNEVNSFLSNPTRYAAAMKKAGDAQARELLERVCECLEKERCERFEDCITWARLKYDLSPQVCYFMNSTILCFFLSMSYHHSLFKVLLNLLNVSLKPIGLL